MEELVISPSDFIALVNQTFDYAYPKVVIQGELANFKISRNKWVYFDLKDDNASVRFFGTVFALPGPLQDGMVLSVSGRPHMHELYGFSVQVQTVQPVGQGSIKKAADLLLAKLQAEGLFDTDKKRSLPYPPQKIGLITSVQSAAYADFIKVIGARFGGLEINVYDVQVQGEQAVLDIVQAIKHFAEHAELANVLVITRGGGSADDLSVFSHEQVVRAVAGSRVPTLIAIGHEVDLSLAELAADVRASTPSNAAELLVPDKKEQLLKLTHKAEWLQQGLLTQLQNAKTVLATQKDHLRSGITFELTKQQQLLAHNAKLLTAMSPHAALQRGYAIVRGPKGIVSSVKNTSSNDTLDITLQDGIIKALVR
ncbi:exodeoxyribonuclease VII large subunit [bacterium]|nr:exodeoxyribonuclease VII large subunit [bacterium]NBX97878.1 exodeoxyribonuclease VII large subunit [bacterium]NDC93882.1 exodeoxyribonuclease VII large subunit [bacterium]NDD82829.1 exodeoxyribonuclease VII large subunit [bacterium]NDG28723.1 exodeoxyribonuclease VII large subunit [bacterium]